MAVVLLCRARAWAEKADGHDSALVIVVRLARDFRRLVRGDRSKQDGLAGS